MDIEGRYGSVEVNGLYRLEVTILKIQIDHTKAP